MKASTSTRSRTWPGCWTVTTGWCGSMSRSATRRPPGSWRRCLVSIPSPSETVSSATAMPKVRAYRDHVFVVLHAPELGQAAATSTTSSWISSSALAMWSPSMGRSTRRCRRSRRCARPAGCAGGSRRDGCARSPFELSYAVVSALGPVPGGVRGDRDQGGVAARAAGHLRAPGRPRGVPGGVVRDPPCPVGGVEHGHPGPPDLRADGRRWVVSSPPKGAAGGRPGGPVRPGDRRGRRARSATWRG